MNLVSHHHHLCEYRQPKLCTYLLQENDEIGGYQMTDVVCMTFRCCWHRNAVSLVDWVLAWHDTIRYDTMIQWYNDTMIQYSVPVKCCLLCTISLLHDVEFSCLQYYIFISHFLTWFGLLSCHPTWTGSSPLVWREGEREGGERKGNKWWRGRGRKEEGRKGREVRGKEGRKAWSELCLHSTWFKLTLYPHL